jgi:hypothetical protein
MILIGFKGTQAWERVKQDAGVLSLGFQLRDKRLQRLRGEIA